jgi:thiamine transport system substrate-binding protein
VHGFLHLPTNVATWRILLQKHLLAAGLFTIATSALAETPVLTVLTYDSFAAEWGPGPAMEKAFETTCACDLQFVTAGDGAALLARVLLEGAGSETDVVLGLDTNLTAKAEGSGLFAPHGQPPVTGLPVPYDNPLFLPYDFGWFAFVYDNTKLLTPPTSFTELAASDLKIVIQDPRSSTPGLGLLLWVKQAYGDGAEALWADLSDNILTVTPGWSEAYGLFLEGEADMVLSYTTSPAYHIGAEGDVTKSAALFSEGHGLQIEVAGKLASTDQPALADAFLAFLTSPEAQAAIPETNWMYPAAAPANGLPASFATLITPGKTLLFPEADAEAARDPAMTEWQNALSR